MKLRIKGNSLRLRLLQTELRKLLDSGRVEETIYFGQTEDARLTYALECDHSTEVVRVRHIDREIAVILPLAEVQMWASSEQVGIYGSIDLGVKGKLEVSVEKDFPCRDLGGSDTADTFQNPNDGANCSD